MSQSEFQDKPDSEETPPAANDAQIKENAADEPETPAEDSALPPETETLPATEEPVTVTEPESQPEEIDSASQPTQGFLYKLFSPETRIGRFMRPALRWAALVVGIFALGFLTAYLLLYRPTRQQLDNANVSIQTLNQQLDKQKAQTDSIQAKMEAALTQAQQDRTALELSTARYQLLATLHQVELARLALANRDGPSAQKSLIEARSQLDLLLPFVKTKDAELAGSLDTRLSLAANELNRDPQTAAADLELFSKALELLDQVYAK